MKKLVCGVILFFALTVQGYTEETPLTAIKTTVDGVLQVLKDPTLKGDTKREIRREKLRKIVYDRFDFEEMSRRAVGRYWRKFSDDEKDEFIKLFGKMLEKSYSDKIESYTDERVEYLSEDIDNGYGIARTKIIKTDGVEVPINYKLLNKDGRWLVYDVLIEGVSLVNNYRNQFRSILRRHKPEYLIEKLKEKTTASY